MYAIAFHTGSVTQGFSISMISKSHYILHCYCHAGFRLQYVLLTEFQRFHTICQMRFFQVLQDGISLGRKEGRKQESVIEFPRVRTTDLASSATEGDLEPKLLHFSVFLLQSDNLLCSSLRNIIFSLSFYLCQTTPNFSIIQDIQEQWEA